MKHPGSAGYPEISGVNVIVFSVGNLGIGQLASSGRPLGRPDFASMPVHRVGLSGRPDFASIVPQACMHDHDMKEGGGNL